jgi:hypothetical protein
MLRRNKATQTTEMSFEPEFRLAVVPVDLRLVAAPRGR